MSDNKQPTTQEIEHLKNELLKLKKFVNFFGALSPVIVIGSITAVFLSTNSGSNISLIVLISTVLVFVFINIAIEYREHYKAITSEIKDEIESKEAKNE